MTWILDPFQIDWGWIHQRIIEVSPILTVGEWRSLVARFVRDEEVPGSNPGSPTISLSYRTSGTGPSGQSAAPRRVVP